MNPDKLWNCQTIHVAPNQLIFPSFVDFFPPPPPNHSHLISFQMQLIKLHQAFSFGREDFRLSTVLVCHNFSMKCIDFPNLFCSNWCWLFRLSCLCYSVLYEHSGYNSIFGVFLFSFWYSWGIYLSVPCICIYNISYIGISFFFRLFSVSSSYFFICPSPYRFSLSSLSPFFLLLPTFFCFMTAPTACLYFNPSYPIPPFVYILTLFTIHFTLLVSTPN